MLSSKYVIVLVNASSFRILELCRRLSRRRRHRSSTRGTREVNCHATRNYSTTERSRLLRHLLNDARDQDVNNNATRGTRRVKRTRKRRRTRNGQRGNSRNSSYRTPRVRQSTLITRQARRIEARVRARRVRRRNRSRTLNGLRRILISNRSRVTHRSTRGRCRNCTRKSSLSVGLTRNGAWNAGR